MFVNLSSPVTFFSNRIEWGKSDRLSTVISCIAFGILLVAATYWIYCQFWQNHHVDVAKGSPLPDLFGMNEKESPVTSPKLEQSFKEDVFDLSEDQIEGEWKKTPKKKLEKSEEILEEFEKNLNKGVDVDEYLRGILSDSDLSAIEDSPKNVVFDTLIPEKNLKIDLEEDPASKEEDCIKFCNSAFEQGSLEDKDFVWELSVSIDSKSQDQAFKILVKELEETPLMLAGKFHSQVFEEKIPSSSSEIDLFVTKKDVKKQSEWKQFLSLIASRFKAEGIEERKNGSKISIDCQEVPPYFSYSMIEEDEWDEENPFKNLIIEPLF